jgi:acyl-CoA thioesterase
VEVHRSSRTAVYRIDAHGEDGRPVATALARVFRTDRAWASGELA